jgi:hypothetical protein
MMGLSEDEWAEHFKDDGPITATQGRAIRKQLLAQLEEGKAEAKRRRIASGFEACL